MKRLVTFAMTILTAVLMAACSVTGKDETTRPNSLADSFQAAVSVTLGELEAEGTLKRFGSGMWDIEFSSPNTLSGIKLSFSDGNVDASYKGLSFSVPQAALPVKSMMLNLISAVDDLAANGELSGVEENGMLKIEGTLDGGDYILTLDKEGKISSFEMPNNDLVIAFTEVTELSGIETPTEASTQTVTGTETAPSSEIVTTEAAA